MSNESDLPIVVLATDEPIAWMAVDALRKQFGRITILQEEKEPRRAFVKRRTKRLGFFTTSGQVLFALAQSVISRRSAARRSEIVAKSGLRATPVAGVRRIPIGSVNSDACRQALRALDPKVVVVVGTRIIKAETLNCVAAPFINLHAGINPKYRGQNGLYWALAKRDPEHAGVTVHLVDEGVDTGRVLYQARVMPEAGDNFTTYQVLQATVGIPLLVRAVWDAMTGRLRPKNVPLPSRQWYHPTLWGYVWTATLKGVW